MEQEKITKQEAERSSQETMDKLFDIARKLPEKQLSRLEGIIMGMQLATAEKAG